MTIEKLPLGRWIESFVDFLNDNASGAIDPFVDTLGDWIDAFITAMKWVPAPVFILAVAAAAYAARRSWKLSAFIAAAFFLIVNLGYWDETIETLALVLGATFVCIGVGVPVGIAAAHRPRLFAFLRPVLDLMQTIPTFVYLIPTLIFFGLGIVPGLISTVIFAIPAPIRLTHLGISNVPKPLLEATVSFGATNGQLLRKVELPHALPTIMAGVTQCIMLSLSMVVIAALVGADGLGKPVVRALNTVNIAQGFEAGLSIVLLAVTLDRLCRPDAPPTRETVR